MEVLGIGADIEENPDVYTLRPETFLPMIKNHDFHCFVMIYNSNIQQDNKTMDLWQELALKFKPSGIKFCTYDYFMHKLPTVSE